MNRRHALIATLPVFLLAPNATSHEVDRPRARDLGVEVGIFPPGPWNAITDVEGVWVGQVTVIEGACRRFSRARWRPRKKRFTTRSSRRRPYQEWEGRWRRSTLRR